MIHNADTTTTFSGLIMHPQIQMSLYIKNSHKSHASLHAGKLLDVIKPVSPEVQTRLVLIVPAFDEITTEP